MRWLLLCFCLLTESYETINNVTSLISGLYYSRLKIIFPSSHPTKSRAFPWFVVLRYNELCNNAVGYGQGCSAKKEMWNCHTIEKEDRTKYFR